MTRMQKTVRGVRYSSGHFEALMSMMLLFILVFVLTDYESFHYLSLAE